MPRIYYLCLALLFGGQGRAQSPNVIVLFTDDQRFNTIAALGQREVYTPNLDRLVAMGVSFDRAHVQGSHHGAVCAPSRAMLLSGRPMQRIPLDYIDRGRADYRRDFDFLTFPEYFRERGYTTFFTGKWHNHTSKLRTGFERAENVFIGGMHWPRDGGHATPWLWHQDTTGRYAEEDRRQGEAFSSRLFTDAALDFLATRPADRPFCVYVAYSSPHDPRMAPAEHVAHYAEADIALPPNYLPEHPFDNGHLRIRDELLVSFPRHPDTIRSEIAAYYAMISEVDAQIGRLLDALEAEELLENTVIVFAGDNGLAVGQHGLLGKQNLYDHSVRVPLIIAAPGLAGNRRATTPAYLYDVFPTLCELTGGQVPEEIGGTSLLPALRDESRSLREAVYLHHAREMRAVRTAEDRKLILTFAAGQTHQQLFDLANDPFETTNLIQDPAYAEVARKLRRQLTEELIATGDDFFTPAIHVRRVGPDGPQELRIAHPEGLTTVRYTLDGSAPGPTSPAYATPLALAGPVTVRAAVYYGTERVGEEARETIQPPRPVARISLSVPPAERYAGHGALTLVDGQRGSLKFKDGRWLGYEGEDVEIVVELPAEEPIRRLGIGYLHRPGEWIFAPAAVAVALSIDGVDYEPALSARLAPPEGGETTVATFVEELAMGETRARFVRFRIEGVGRGPAGHPGAGLPVWLFLDELIID